MFENITFITFTPKTRMSSTRLTADDFNNPKYSRENLLNSKFSIQGSVNHFQKPPITDFALQNLFHLQNFDIFYYKFDSFTERRNFHSFLILYTYSGQGMLTYKNKTYTLSEGDGFFINCMDYHFYKVTDTHWDTGVLHLGGPLLPALHEQYLQTNNVIFHESTSGKYQHYLERLLYIYSYPHLHRDWQASTCIDIMLNYLLLLNAETNEKKNDKPQSIRYLLKYMESNYSQHLSLDFLASFTNMDKYYLSKEFKKYTGFSPNDYLISLRINQAKNLLKTTSFPAVQIAHEVGIHDMNNFTKLFKKKTGMTPIQYRKYGDLFL